MLFLLLAACGAPDDTGASDAAVAVTIPFRARLGDGDVACGSTLAGLGTSGADADLLDLRFFVHDVVLLDEQGEAVPVTLDEDGRWQNDLVALVDLEDGSGACSTGSPDVHTAVTGTVPMGHYHGLRFKIGVPEAMNHLDAATAPAPLNDPALWWTWTSGYKFLKVDVATPVNPSFVLHLGATDCAGDPATGYACGTENVPEVQLDELMVHAEEGPEAETMGEVSVDLGALHAGSDLLSAPPAGDHMAGCMSGPTDPQCAPIFAALGLPFGDVQAPAAQTVFRVGEAR
jgi:uncharacterized repeat protein (TIGR04052 family)